MTGSGCDLGIPTTPPFPRCKYSRAELVYSGRGLRPMSSARCSGINTTICGANGHIGQGHAY